MGKTWSRRVMAATIATLVSGMGLIVLARSNPANDSIKEVLSPTTFSLATGRIVTLAGVDSRFIAEADSLAAIDHLKSVLEGKPVRITADRTLVRARHGTFVYLSTVAPAISINEELLRHGWAIVIDDAFDRKKTYAAIEHTAAGQRVGLWRNFGGFSRSIDGVATLTTDDVAPDPARANTRSGARSGEIDYDRTGIGVDESQLSEVAASRRYLERLGWVKVPARP